MKHRPLLILVLISLGLTALSFYPSLKNGFTNWDDTVYVLNNPFIKDLSFDGLKNIFGRLDQDLYKPLVEFSYALEYYFFKLDPFYFHLTNFVFHLLNTAFVFWFIWLISRNLAVAFIASVFFGIHPLHVESVAWISERKDMMHGFFFLSALISYIYYRKHQRKSSYLLCFLFFLLALLSKPAAVILPLILLTLDFFIFGGINKKLIFQKVHFFVIALLFSGLTLWMQYACGAVKQGSIFTLSDRLLLASRGVVFYLSKVLVPVKLSCLYAYPEEIHRALRQEFLWGAVIFTALCILAAVSVKYTKKVLFGFLFFLISLLPVSQIIPSGPALAADRYTYISSIGIFYIAGEFFNRVYYYSLFNRKRLFRVAWCALLILLIAVFSHMTWKRCLVWKDSITLWTDVLKNYPDTVFGYLNRGSAYSFKGEHGKAMDDYNELIRRKPKNASGYNNRGYEYSLAGESEKAFADFNQALRLEPDFAPAYNNRGFEYTKNLKFEEAVKDFSLAVQFEPQYTFAYNNRGSAYSSLGQFDKAMADFTKAISLKSDYAPAYSNRGNLFSQRGDQKQAILDYEKALKIDPGLAEVYNNRGYAYTFIKEYDKAVEDFIHALKLKPGYETARRNLLRAKRLKEVPGEPGKEVMPKS